MLCVILVHDEITDIISQEFHSLHDGCSLSRVWESHGHGRLGIHHWRSVSRHQWNTTLAITFTDKGVMFLGLVCSVASPGFGARRSVYWHITGWQNKGTFVESCLDPRVRLQVSHWAKAPAEIPAEMAWPLCSVAHLFTVLTRCTLQGVCTVWWHNWWKKWSSSTRCFSVQTIQQVEGRNRGVSGTRWKWVS